MNDPKSIRKYTNDEVGAILRRAFERQSGEGRISHDELLETAREIGVSATDIEEAVAEEERIREARARVDAELRRARLVFFVHLSAYVLGNAVLFAVNMVQGGAVWFYWPLIVWTLALVLHAAWLALVGGPEAARRTAEIEATRGQSRARIDAAFRSGPVSVQRPKPKKARYSEDESDPDEDTQVGRHRLRR